MYQSMAWSDFQLPTLARKYIKIPYYTHAYSSYRPLKFKHAGIQYCTLSFFSKFRVNSVRPSVPAETQPAQQYCCTILLGKDRQNTRFWRPLPTIALIGDDSPIMIEQEIKDKNLAYSHGGVAKIIA